MLNPGRAVAQLQQTAWPGLRSEWSRQGWKVVGPSSRHMQSWCMEELRQISETASRFDYNFSVLSLNPCPRRRLKGSPLFRPEGRDGP